MNTLLDKLNDRQKEAVTHEGGPLMIIAGAGTGKTTVITHRIAWLIQEQGVPAKNILALTFTEKAATEMEERVDRLLPVGHLDLQVSTFHAFCERFLRQEGTAVGIRPQFRVLSELDTWLLARAHLDRFPLVRYKPRGNPTRHLKPLLAHVARLKDEGISPDDYEVFISRQPKEEREHLEELLLFFRTYESLLDETASVDFAGLMGETVRTLETRAEIRKRVQKTYTHLLVDEFQDTNALQYRLVRILLGSGRQITVVGDDDQAIYQFRGASIRNILSFTQDFPDARRVVLQTNYRSYQDILDTSHQFIQANNPHRLEVEEHLSKKLTADRTGKGIVEHRHFTSVFEEAREVVRDVVEKKQSDPEALWSDFAILVRAHAHAKPFTAILEQRRVPFRFHAQDGLYSRSVILDATALLRIVHDPFDHMSWWRVLSHPASGVPMRDLQTIQFIAQKQGVPVVEVLETLPDTISGNTREAIRKSLELQATFAEESRRMPASRLFVELIKASGLMTFIQTLHEAIQQETFGYLQAFYERILQFESRTDEPLLRPFLAEFDDERASGEEGAMKEDVALGPDAVHVLTVHASKGLEFKSVYVVNLVDQRFPSRRQTEGIPLPEGLLPVEDRLEAHLEEERRLFYVACTRARDRLIFTSATDYGGVRAKKPSPFLSSFPTPTSTIPSTQVQESFVPPIQIGEGEATMVVDIPSSISYTQLESYRTCPLQYKFAHVFRIPIVGRYQMSYGKSLHAALEQFFRQWIENAIMPERSVLEQALKDTWIDAWYPNRRAHDEHRATTERVLAAYYLLLKKEPVTPLAVEKTFSIRLGNAIIRGSIDRVDRTPEGLHLIDYKTGSPKTKAQIVRAQKDQLYLYQLAASKLFDEPVARLSFCYLEDTSCVSFLGTPKDLDTLQTSIESMMASVQSRSFDPTPGRHCQSCDFAEICEFREL